MTILDELADYAKKRVADAKKRVSLEEIKKQAKPSILESLRKEMEEQRKRDSEKQSHQKQNMEL